MHSKKLVGLGLLAVSAGLIACAPHHAILAPPLDSPAQVAEGDAFLPRPGHSIVSFTIRWPDARSTQAIPQDTRSLVITLTAGDQEVASKTVVRGASATEKVEFDLNPSLGVVGVSVQALNQAGEVLARGATSVALRDNSVVRASVMLTADAMYLSNEAALAFLNEPKNLFANWQTYPTHPDAQAIMTAMMTVFRQFPALGYPTFMQAPQGARRVDMPEEFLRYASGPGALDLENSLIKRLYWPGYSAGMTLTDDAGRKTFEVTLAPDGRIPGDPERPADQSTGKLRLDVSASEWRDERSLALEGRFLTENSQEATRSVAMFGGKVPATNTLSGAEASVEFVPNGNAALKLSASAKASDFVDMSALPIFVQSFPGAPWSTLPTVLQGTFDSPDFKVSELRVGLRPDLTGASLKGSFSVRDAAGEMHPMTADVVTTWVLGAPPYGYGFTMRKNETAFSLVDRFLNMRAAGSLRMALEPNGAMTQTITVRFYNHVTNRLLGALDYQTQPGEDMTRLAHWPLLKLYADADNPHQVTSEFRLTPGYFAGNPSADGSLAIGVY